MQDQNDKVAQSYIRDLFSFGTVSLRDNGNTYRYTVNAFSRHPRIVYYFNSFPLKTKKRFTFSRWSSILTMCLNGEHLSNPGFSRIRDLVKLVNRDSSLPGKS